MSAICSRCGKHLPPWFTVTLGAPEPDDAWHMINPAPNAAANFGPTVMVPVCNKCDPMPTLAFGNGAFTNAIFGNGS